MRFGLIFVVLLVVQPVASLFDFPPVTTFWEDVKDKLVTFIRGNGTITNEQASLIEKLNSTSSESADFHERLLELKNLVNEQLRTAQETAEKKELETMIKKFGSRIRQHIRKTGDNLAEVNEKLHVANKYYQGDMILTERQKQLLSSENVAKRQAIIAGSIANTWDRNVVYYSLAPTVSNRTRQVAIKAVNFWQDNTCLTFINSDTIAQRINIIEGGGCYSSIGKTGGVQSLSLGGGCDSVGTAVHEFGHALGFFHTQSRYDRDNAIIVFPQNAEYDMVYNFDKETDKTNNNYGMPYDYGSVMQYAASSFSINGKPTIIAKDRQYQDTMGSDITSFVDISMMNSLYGCKDYCKNAPPLSCQNGGYPHPRDCSKCMCPSGFGGKLCNERPAGCGKTLVATRDVQYLEEKFGVMEFNFHDDFMYCNWLITAPNATDRIQVQIMKYTRPTCIEGCIYGGLELKWKKDPTLTGSRYCCPNDVDTAVFSDSNVLPVIAFNRYHREEFVIAYRVV